ncbi:hypothetical protein RYZ26_18075 [Terasakiella sp. A23]|uniref:hypothetical protein n=1 Tax=Terasakiella sp. FCG-A23 TaxID=3080561 RepID=UPI00295582DB|nr:hypothetical protein [Terasakiella sp. A23]MDV7341519.1 hypothetical protein [Terasakiella sp. A23]
MVPSAVFVSESRSSQIGEGGFLFLTSESKRMTQMSLFPDFSNMFRVGKTISQDANTDPNDVLNTKNALAQTGDYQIPDFGITDVPDMGMIDGLKSFQQKHDLKVDGVMKPGGPTESTIADVLNTQGGDGADLPTSKKPINPKPGKIDPLTGLPEVKMPNPKTSGKGLWEHVGQAPKPVTTPWFQSPQIKPLPDEDHSSNTRALDGMLQYTKNGSLPALFADTLKTGDEKAVNEFANFMQQLNARKPERAAEFEQEVMNKVPGYAKQTLVSMSQMEEDNGEDKTQKHLIDNLDSEELQSHIKASSAGGDLEDVVDDANEEYPGANMRITSRGRTVRRQAQLMARRRMRSRDDFLSTYTNHYYIIEMDEWVTNNPDASFDEVTDEFEGIIEEALDAGYKVSNHLEGNVIDVSIPKKHRSEVKSYMENSGVRVLDEGNAMTGPHWHLEFQ